MSGDAVQAGALTAVDRAGIRSEIVSLAWPVVLQALLRTTLFLADTLMLGKYSSAALAAVALGGPVAHTLSMILAALGTGALATVARATGARDRPLQEQEAATSIAVGAGLGAIVLVMVLPVLPWLGQIIGALKVDPQLAGAASSYVGWIVLASPFMLLSSAAAGILRASGDTRTPLYVAILANVLNIGGNYVLIFGKFGAPEMGVAGAALSSSIAMAVEALVLTGWLFTSGSTVRLRVSSFATVTRASIRRLVKVSLPAAAEPVLLQIGFLSVIAMMAALGKPSLAAHRVAISLESISFMPGWALAIACGAIVGQYLGARRPDKAAAGLRESTRIAVLVMVPLGVGFLLFAGPLADLFTKKGDPDAPAVAAMSAACLRVASIEQVLMGVAVVVGGALRGAGDTRGAMLVGVLGVWGVRLPLSYLFAYPLGLGVVGVWIVMIIDWGARAAAFSWVWRQGRWRTLQL